MGLEEMIKKCQVLKDGFPSIHFDFDFEAGWGIRTREKTTEHAYMRWEEVASSRDALCTT